MITVICCGNPHRGDDGVASNVFRLLDARQVGRTAGVRLLDAGIDGMSLMYSARGSRTLVIVDACRSGSAPGTVFEIPGTELAIEPPSILSSHEFRWEHALFAGRKIFGGTFPTDVTVFLIEGADFTLGCELSPAAAGAAVKVADKIDALIGTRQTRSCPEAVR